jgi:hypothetical protein
MELLNLKRIFGTRLFVWRPNGYFVVGILDRVGIGYTVIVSYKTSQTSPDRPSVGIGQFRYINVEDLRDENDMRL